MNVNNNYNRPKTTGDILKVLSLFDGLSGARIVLDRLGIPCDYFASEVDKYAMKISQKNYPDIEQLGDVRNITGKMIGKVDLLVAGFLALIFRFLKEIVKIYRENKVDYSMNY